MPTEGYWRQAAKPDKTDLPFPVANEQAWPEEAAFLESLTTIEQVAEKSHARGFSICRLCRCYNGSAEYSFGDWNWPEGLKHYVEEHHVKPSDAFTDCVLGR